MSKYLVVANQTLISRELVAMLRELLERDPQAQFTLLVPAGVTPAPDVDAAMVAALDAQAALMRMEMPIAALRLGDLSPVTAVAEELCRDSYAAIVMSTLPPGLSNWLRLDAVSRIRRAVSMPVHHVIAEPNWVDVAGMRSIFPAVVKR